MNTFASRIALILSSLLFCTHAQALTIPASDDTTAFNGRLTTAAHRAKTLTVDATHTAFVGFDLTGIPQDATIRFARLRLFLPAIRAKGNGLTVHKVTSPWSEATASDWPSYAEAPVASISTNAMGVMRFVSVDVTSVVQEWVQSGSLNAGLAIAAASMQPVKLTASVTIPSKEGPEVGLPAQLEVELQGPQGESNSSGGTSGATGPAGPKGDKGATGPAGPVGPAGPKGDTGATGPQGVAGLSGGVESARASIGALLYSDATRSIPVTATDVDNGPIGVGYIKLAAPFTKLFTNGVTINTAGDTMTITKAGLYYINLHVQLKSGANLDSLGNVSSYNPVYVCADIIRSGTRLQGVEAHSLYSAEENMFSSSFMVTLTVGDSVYATAGYWNTFNGNSKSAGTVRDLGFEVMLVHATP
ncbi:MAG: DNRLRE domain-containing protein [Verrucomicrobiota bacterium]